MKTTRLARRLTLAAILCALPLSAHSAFGQTNLVVNNGNQTLNILSGTTSSNLSTLVGSSTDNNTLNVAGNLTNSNSGVINVGGNTGTNGSNNALNISNGGYVYSENPVSIGISAVSSNNTVTVNGTGSTLTSNNAIYVGVYGSNNHFEISNGGYVRAKGLYIADKAASSNNTALITGANSTLVVDYGVTSVYIGQYNGGTNSTLTLANGGALLSNTANASTPSYNRFITIASNGSGTLNFGRFGESDTAGTTDFGLIRFDLGNATGAINFNQTDALTLTSAIFGGTTSNSSINQLGSGTTTLTGNFTSNATTTISSGTLSIGNGSATSNITSNINTNITNNSALIFNRSKNSTYTGAIIGNGTLEKLGAGALTLSGNNTYTGGTTVTAGTLAITGSVNGTSSVAVNGGSTLTVTGALTANGAVNANNGTITIGQGGAITVIPSVPQSFNALYAANMGDNTLSVFDLNDNNSFITSIGSGILQGSSGIAIGSNGTIYVSNAFSDSVSVFDSSGTLTGTINGGNLNNPWGVAIDSAGKIYVANSAGNSISVFNPDGSPNQTITDPSFSGLQGLAIDSNNLLYAANWLNSSISVFDLNTNTSSGTISSNFGNLDGPGGLAISSNGILYAANYWGNSISSMDTNEEVPPDTLTDPSLNGPSGLAISADGTLYAANFNNSTISIFSSNVTTIGNQYLSQPRGLAIGNFTIAGEPVGITLATSASDNATLNIGTYGGNDTSATVSTPYIAFGNGTAALNLNLAGNTTISSALNGGGANSTVNQLGTGTTTLTSTNSTFAGTVNINSGTLAVTSSLANATTRVNSGGTLAGNGTLGNVTMNSGGTISPGNSPGTITVGNLTLNAGAIYNWQTSSNGTSGTAGTDWDLISSLGALTLNATSGSPITINLSSLGNATLAGVKKASWEIGNFTTGITGFDRSAFTFNSTGMTGNAGGYFMSLGTGNLTLVLNYKTGAVWNTASGNWSTASQWEGNSLPENGDGIEFSGPGGTSTNDGYLTSVSGITFTTTTNGSYTLTGTDLAFGADGLVNNSNSTQTVAINLALGADQTFAANTANLVVSGNITGGYSLTKEGNQTITFAGANTYTGDTTINAGTLAIAQGGSLTGTSKILVGNSTSGNSLSILGTVGAGNLTLSEQVGSNDNTATVGGGSSPASLTVANLINVGFGGTGNTLDILGNGTVTAASTWIGGYGSNNTANVNGGVLNSTSDVVVGYFQDGNNLNITSGGNVTAGSLILGLDPGSSRNALLVSGAGSVFSSSGLVYLGQNGTSNSITVALGGKFLSGNPDAVLGLGTVSTGNSLSIDGTGSQFTNNGTFYVGRAGSNNTLSMVNGGSLSTRNGRIGHDSTSSNNTATVSGNGSKWTNTGTLRVGSDGSNNSLAVTSGANVTVGGNTFIGHGAASANNLVSVEGAGSVLNLANATVGLSGSNNTLLVADSGTINAIGIQLSGTNSTLQIGNGAAGGTVSTSLGIGTGSGTGHQVVFNHTDSNLAFSPILTGNLSVSQIGNGTTALTANNIYSGSTTISAGTLSIGNGGTSGSVTGDITNNSALVFNRSDAVVFAGLISGNGAVAKLASNTLTLAADNTYTGATTISAGTLQLGNGGISGSVAGEIVNNGVLAIDRSDDVIFTNTLTGTGSVLKLGTNTLTYDTTISPQGGTTVDAGTLQVSGTTSAVTVNSGGTLIGSGNTGDVIVRANGTISANGFIPDGRVANPDIGTLTVGNMTLSGGAFYNWQTSSIEGTAGTDWDLISSLGTLTLNATPGSPITINLSSLGNATLAGVKKASWEIGNFTTGITGFDRSAFTFNSTGMIGSEGGYFMSLGTGNLTLVLNYKTGAVWNTASGNWSTASQWEGNSLPENGDGIEFSGPGGTSTNDGYLASVSGITFTTTTNGSYTLTGTDLAFGADGLVNNSNSTQTVSINLALGANQTFAANTANLVVSGNITGGHSLTKEGNQTLVLAGANSYTGTTQVSNGTVVLANRNALYGGNTTNWTAGNITVGLAYGSSTSDSIFGASGGPALVLRAGGAGQFTAGDIALLANNLVNGTASGNMTGQTGTGFASQAVLGIDTTGGNIAMQEALVGGTNVFQVNGDDRVQTYSLVKLGSGTLDLAGNNTYSIGNFTNTDPTGMFGEGFTVVQAGTLRLGNGTGLGTPISFVAGNPGAGAALQVDGGNLISILSTVGLRPEELSGLSLISGNQTYPTFTGQGVMNVTGGNVSSMLGMVVGGKSGQLNITGGDVVVGMEGADVTLGLMAGVLPGANGTINVAGGNLTATNVTLGGLPIFGNDQVLGGNGTINLSAGNLAVAGTVVVGFGNGSTGLVYVTGGNGTAGSVILGAGSASQGGLLVSGGTLLVTGQVPQPDNRTVQSPALLVGGDGIGGLSINGTGKVIVAGALSKGNQGDILLESGGTLQIGYGGVDGFLDTALTNNGTLVFDVTGDLTHYNTIDGTGAVEKSGNGTLVLSGSSGNYIGATTVQAGTLALDSGYSNTSSAVSVLANATLAGSGTAGDVTLLANGTISPNLVNSLGRGANNPEIATLTVGNLTLNGGGIYNWNLASVNGAAGTDWDLISATGGISINATSGEKFVINATALDGSGFDSDTRIYTWTIAESATGITGFSADKFAINTAGFEAGIGAYFTSANSTALNLNYATVATWNAGSGNWTTVSNWEDSFAPINGVAVEYAGPNGSGGTSTNDATSLTNIRTLEFTGGANASYTLAGGNLTIDAGLVNNSTFTQTVGINLALGADQTFAANTANLIVSGNITGGYSLTKEGNQTLTFAGANTYTGDTTINAGTLAIAAGGSINGPSTSTTVVGNSTSGNTLAILGSASVGAVTLGQEEGADGNTITIGGGSSPAALTVADATNVGFAGTGNTLGILANGTATANTTIVGFLGANNSLNITGGALNNTSDLEVGLFGGGNALNITAGGNATIGGSLTAGQVSGENSIQVSGAGSRLFAGTLTIGNAGSNNTLAIASGGSLETGGAVIGANAGSSNNTATVSGPGSSLASTLDLEVGRDGSNNTLAITGGANATADWFVLIGRSGTSANNTLLVADSGTLNAKAILLAGTNSTLQIGNGSASGTINANDGIGTGDGTGHQIVFNHTDSNLDFSPVLSGNLAVSHIGNGTTSLLGENSYTGGTAISAGTLQIGNNGTSGSVAGDITNNAALAFNRSDDLIHTGNITGTGSLQKLGAGVLTLAGSTNTVGSATITAGGLALSASSLTTNGAVNIDTGTLTIAEGGTLNADPMPNSNGITLAASASDNATLNLGTLGGSDTTATLGTPFIQFGDGTSALNLNLAGDSVFLGEFRGGGANSTINQLGTGTTTVASENNTFAGTANIKAGTLQVGGSLANAAILAEGGTLAGGGTVGDTTILANGTISPGGNTPVGITVASIPSGDPEIATLSVGNLTLHGGGAYNWSIISAGGTAGTDWDLVSATGGLVLSANSTNQFVIGVFGDALGFSEDERYTWDIASFGSNITAASSAFKVDLSNSAFGSETPKGVFFVGTNATQLTLRYLPQAVWTGTNGTWSDSANWLGNQGPVQGIGIAFEGPGGTSTNNIVAETLSQVEGISFLDGAGAYSVAGNTLQIGADGIVNSSANLQTVGMNLTAGEILLVDAATAGIEISGIVSGASALSKTGFETLTLSGNNTYTGGTTISAGTLALGGTAGSVNGTITVASGATFAVQRTNNATLTNLITGEGSFAQTGTGVTSIIGNNTYTGGTSITSGTLWTKSLGALGNGSATLGRGVTVFSLPPVSQPGTLLVSSTQEMGGNLLIGGDLNWYDGTIAYYDTGSSPASGDLTINVGGNFFVSPSTGNATFDFSGVEALDAGVYTLINATSILAGGTNFVAAHGQYTKLFGNFTTTNSTVVYTVTGAESGGPDIQNNGGPNTPVVAVFDVTGPTITVGANNTVNALNFTSNASLTINATGQLTLTSGNLNVVTGNSVISGGVLNTTGNFEKLGSGELVLQSNTNVNGTASVVGGVLSVNGNLTANSVGVDSAGTFLIGANGVLNNGTFSQSITNNGSLIFAGTNNQTLSGQIAGTGNLTVNSAGTLILSGVNAFAGGTAINNGTLVIANTAGLGTGVVNQSSGQSLLVINTTGNIQNNLSIYNVSALQNATISGLITVNNASYDVSPGATLTLANTINGTGGVTKNGLGTLTLLGNNTYTGATAINAGTISLSTVQSVASTSGIQLGNATELLYTGTNGTITRNITLASGTGTISNAGSGLLTLFGAISKNGSTLVLQGGKSGIQVGGVISGSAPHSDLVVVNHVTLTAANTYNGPTVISNGATLELAAGGLLGGGNYAQGITNNGTFIFSGTNDQTLSGDISGSGALTQNGPGSLILNGNNTYTGATIINSGTLFLNGSLTGSAVSIGASGTLAGTGAITSTANVIISGNLAPGFGNIGNFTITAPNLDLTGSNSTIIQIASAASFDQIAVTGQITLGGNLTILEFGNRTLAYGQRYAIFTATGGFSGNYSAINTPAEFVNRRARLLISGTTGTLLIAPLSYVPLALNQNQRNVAAALDSFILANGGDRQTVSIALDSLTAAKYPAAFDAIMPGFYETLGDMVIEQAYNQTQLLNQRLSSVRLGASGFQAIGMSQPLKYDIDGDSVAEASTLDFVSAARGENGIWTPARIGRMAGSAPAAPAPYAPLGTNWNSWVMGIGEFAMSRGLSGVPNYNNNAGGFLAGADYRFGPTLSAGVYAGYQYNYAKYSNGSSTQGNSALFGLYASYANEGGYYADAVIGGGYTGFQTRRSIEFPGIDRTATADPGSGQFSAALNLGKDFQVGKFTLGPIAGAQYTYAGIGAFTESGADSLNLSLDQQNVNSLRTNLGARLAYNWEICKNTVLIPEVRGFWMHEFLNNPANITSSLNGGAGPTFDYETETPYRDSIFGGVGVSAKLGERWSASAFYNVNFGAAGYTNNIISTTLGFSF